MIPFFIPDTKIRILHGKQAPESGLKADYGDLTGGCGDSTLLFCLLRSYLCSKEFRNRKLNFKNNYAMLPLTDLFSLFISGGPVGMITITLLFIGLFFAAWKAPRWVKEIGLFALAFGFLGQLLGIFQVLSVLRDYALRRRRKFPV